MTKKVTELPTARKVCASCAFQALEQMQGQITRQMVCHRMPPTVSMVTTPQGIQGMTLFPIVQPTMYCFEWRPKDPETLSLTGRKQEPEGPPTNPIPGPGGPVQDN